MTPHEQLLRDMAQCPDLFGATRCAQMQHAAEQLTTAQAGQEA